MVCIQTCVIQQLTVRPVKLTGNLSECIKLLQQGVFSGLMVSMRVTVQPHLILAAALGQISAIDVKVTVNMTSSAW